MSGIDPGRRGLLCAAAVAPLAVLGGPGLIASAAADPAPSAEDPAPPVDLAALTDPSDRRLANPMPAGFAPLSPLTRAHAHNDYEHEHPLWDALGQGFTSIEADVWFRGGRLLVGHTLLDTIVPRPLETLYLQPLAAWVRSQGGTALPGWDGTLQLLIDIKEEGARSLQAIEAMLARYADVLARVENGVHVPGPVQVVYSGSRPFEVIADAPVRYGAMDGHDGDLGHHSSQDMPMVSEDWARLGWQGFGEMPTGQREDLRDLVGRIHAAGSRARFWGVPELLPARRRILWDTQLDAGVDLISTDHLAELRAHLMERGLA